MRRTATFMLLVAVAYLAGCGATASTWSSTETCTRVRAADLAGDTHALIRIFDHVKSFPTGDAVIDTAGRALSDGVGKGRTVQSDNLGEALYARCAVLIGEWR